MRGFFFLLLLTNVALGAWQYHLQRSGSEGVDIYRGIAMVSNGLTLLSEVPAGEGPALRNAEEGEATGQGGAQPEPQPKLAEAGEVGAKQPAAAEAMMKKAGRICYRIAGIEERQQLDALIDRLRESGASAIEQQQQQVSQTNYWVVLPAYASRKKANEAAEILTAKRVKDFFIVRSGEHENAVSLGVFSTRERAERRYEQIIGLKARLRRPRIEALELPGKRYTISYELGKGAAQRGIEDDLRQQGMRAAEKISCK
jgi:hypothetical protein